MWFRVSGLGFTEVCFYFGKILLNRLVTIHSGSKNNDNLKFGVMKVMEVAAPIVVPIVPTNRRDVRVKLGVPANGRCVDEDPSPSVSAWRERSGRYLAHRKCIGCTVPSSGRSHAHE